MVNRSSFPFLNQLTSVVLAISLGLGVSTPTYAPAQTRVEATDETTLHDAEQKLILEIDHQADAVFAEFQKSYPQAPLSAFRKYKRAVIYRLKQLNALADILKASGPAPALTLIAVQVVGDYILAPLLFMSGHPLYGGAIVALPLGSIAGAAVFALQIAKTRLKIARQLGVRSLRDLDKIQQIIIGYELKHRVTTKILTMLGRETIEFDIVAKQSGGPSVSIGELEEMIRSSEKGRGYLNFVYEQRLDSVSYADLLLKYIVSHTDSASWFLENLSARVSADTAAQSVTEARTFRSLLIARDDAVKALKRDLRRLEEERSKIKQGVKHGAIASEDARVLKAHLTSQAKRLQDLKFTATREMYTVLRDANSQLTPRSKSRSGSAGMCSHAFALPSS